MRVFTGFIEKGENAMNKKMCLKCEKEKRIDKEFFMSSSNLHTDKKFPICKSCLRETVNIEDVKSVQDILMQMNKPFLYDLWESSYEEGKRTNKDIFGIYLKNVFLNFKRLNWANSQFETERKEVVRNDQDEVELEQNPSKRKEVQVSEEELEKLKEDYGYGYPDNEYLLFDRKFRQLKPSFQLLTTMHEECLREYCVNKVKETLAKARGDFKEAKDWAAMAKDVAEAGKLKPSQMSKADLSAGLDGFGQLARMVEEKVDIIPVLPKFTSQPKDKPDVVLWCYINYVRDLKGMPEADYKDIFHFYEERRADYEKQELDNDPSMRDSQ